MFVRYIVKQTAWLKKHCKRDRCSSPHVPYITTWLYILSQFQIWIIAVPLQSTKLIITLAFYYDIAQLISNIQVKPAYFHGYLLFYPRRCRPFVLIGQYRLSIKYNNFK